MPTVAQYIKVAIERVKPRWSAIGARIHRPALSPAYLGENVLEQDSVGQTVAGSVEALIAVQRAGHDIILHLQDDGPEHLLAQTTYSFAGVVYFHTARHISAAYSAPALGNPDPFTTNLVYSSDSSVLLARESMTRERVQTTLKQPYTHYKRWIWVKTMEFERIPQLDAWRYTPFFKVLIEVDNGPLFVTAPCIIQAAPGTDPWMRGMKEWSVKSYEFLLPGTVLRSITNELVRDDYAYICFMHTWFGGKLDGCVRVFVAEQYRIDDEQRRSEPGGTFSFDLWPNVSVVGAKGTSGTT